MNEKNTKTELNSEYKIQKLMDEVYSKWQETGNANKNDILKQFSKSHDVAVRFGNFNYQVENGGIQQWIMNGYFNEDIDMLINYVNIGIDLGFEEFEYIYNIFSELISESNTTDYNSFGDARIECDYCRGYGCVESTYEDEEEDCSECGGSGYIECNLVDVIYDNEFDKWYYTNCNNEDGDWWDKIYQIILEVEK